jgi:cell division protein FtsB
MQLNPNTMHAVRGRPPLATTWHPSTDTAALGPTGPPAPGALPCKISRGGACAAWGEANPGTPCASSQSTARTRAPRDGLRVPVFGWGCCSQRGRHSPACAALHCNEPEPPLIAAKKVLAGRPRLPAMPPPSDCSLKILKGATWPAMPPPADCRRKVLKGPPLPAMLPHQQQPQSTGTGSHRQNRTGQTDPQTRHCSMRHLATLAFAFGIVLSFQAPVGKMLKHSFCAQNNAHVAGAVQHYALHRDKDRGQYSTLTTHREQYSTALGAVPTAPCVPHRYHSAILQRGGCALAAQLRPGGQPLPMAALQHGTRLPSSGH